MSAAKSEVSLQVCRPKTSDHRRAMKWMSSLSRVLEDNLATEESGQAADERMSLQHSLQFYGIFAQTGDERYLKLSEDFLKYSLHTKAPRRSSR